MWKTKERLFFIIEQPFHSFGQMARSPTHFLLFSVNFTNTLVIFINP